MTLASVLDGAARAAHEVAARSTNGASPGIWSLIETPLNGLPTGAERLAAPLL